MGTLIDSLAQYTGEILTFLITAGAAYLKRKHDLKQIAKDNAQREYFSK